MTLYRLTVYGQPKNTKLDIELTDDERQFLRHITDRILGAAGPYQAFVTLRELDSVDLAEEEAA